MIKVSRIQLDKIIKENQFCVVQIDASWNKTGLILKEKNRKY
jgi:hypothetical protein